MHKISTMLRTGNLTAREKFLLLIQNDVHKMKTGKEILTPADKDALENWKAKTDFEAREWNRLNEAWKHTGRMDIEVEFIYKDAQVSYLAQLPILMKLISYPSHREMLRRIEVLGRLKKVSIDEAVEIAGKQRAEKLREGMDFEYAAYRLAFDLLDPEDRKGLKELYGDVKTEHQYLDEEEVIADLYGDEDDLSDEAKDRLAALVAERSYNAYAKEYQLFHYYACIPLLEVARYFLKEKGIAISDEKETYHEVTDAMKAYAAEHKTTVEAMLTQGARAWLDDGLLDRYSPLVVSSAAELFARWRKTRDKARKALRARIKKGILTLRQRTDGETRKEKLVSKGLHTGEREVTRAMIEEVGLEKDEIDEKAAFATFDESVITGESLYNLKEDYEFVREFKERVDTYDPNLGIVYADDDPDHEGNHLDQELLVCQQTSTGEASWLSLYGMSMEMLSSIQESETFFKETQEGDETILAFKSPGLEEVFRERRQNLIAGYAKLLAFAALFKRLETTYETDLASHAAERLELVRGCIEQANEAIQIATGTSDTRTLKGRRIFFKREEVIRFEDDPAIDIEAIAPDEEAVKEHEATLRKILGDF